MLKGALSVIIRATGRRGMHQAGAGGEVGFEALHGRGIAVRKAAGPAHAAEFLVNWPNEGRQAFLQTRFLGFPHEDPVEWLQAEIGALVLVQDDSPQVDVKNERRLVVSETRADNADVVRGGAGRDPAYTLK